MKRNSMISHDVSLKWVIAIVAVTACITLHCVDVGPVAGTVTQSGNGMVCGSVADSGVPMPGVRVLLVPTQYDPISDTSLPDSLVDTTGPSGIFRIIAPKSMTYNVEVENRLGKNALRYNVGFSDRDTQNIEPLSLTIPGRISVIIPDTASSDTSYVYIPGTTFFSKVHAGTAVIGNVPAGLIPMVSYRSSKNGPDGRIIKKNVVVTSGMTTTISDSLRAYSKRLYLNTSTSGAYIAGNIMNFPVLIRLTSNNFDFSQAKSGGEDIRFAKIDGTSLPFEIECWNTAVQQAAVWVKIDTVYGNDSTHSFMMFWGGSAVNTESNGSAVFDTSNSFQGVWHLSENGDTTNDATNNAFNGIDSGTTASAGMIGNAKKFSNGSNIEIPGLLGSPASITLSAWVNAGPTDPAQNGNLSQEIVSIGDAALIRLDNGSGIGTCGSYHVSVIPISKDTNFQITGSGRYLANTGWHYIAFAINTTTKVQTLFIDGEQCAISHSTNPIVYGDLGSNTFIGIHGNGKKTSCFNGLIDEVRVNKTSLSSDWIKLCYMNQKTVDMLIKFTN